MLDGEFVVPFGASESSREGVLMLSALSFLVPFCTGPSSAGPGETGAFPLGDDPNGWKPFMAMLGNSSIRKLDFRKLCAVARLPNQSRVHLES